MTEKPITLAYLNDRAIKLCLIALTALAIVAGLKLGKSLLAPIALALVTGIVLAPQMRRLERLGLPRSAGAALVMLVGVAGVFGLLISLAPVFNDFFNALPSIQRELAAWIEETGRSLRGLRALGQSLSDTIEGGADGEAVDKVMPSLLSALWVAPNFLGQVLTFAGTLFFFLLTRETLYARLPFRRQVLCADRAVSHYFVAVTLINVGLGVATMLVISATGLPGGAVWGLAAALLNFVLYLGPLTLMLALTIAGAMNFDGAATFLPPLAFLVLNVIESQFVTPFFVGRSMQINPLCVFLAILVGLWLWGATGGIVALPLVVWVNALFMAAPAARPTTSAPI